LLLVSRPHGRGEGSLVLVSPEGRSYLAAELPPDVEVTLEHWDPGSARALVTVSPVVDGYTQTGVRGWLDVRTGEVTTDPGGLEEPGPDPATPSFVGIDHRGREVWIEHEVSGDGSAPGTLAVLDEGRAVHRLELGIGWHDPMLDPNARVVLTSTLDFDGYRLVDLDAGSLQTYELGGYCQLVGWTGVAHVLTVCEPEPEPEHLDGRGPEFSELFDLRVGDEHVTPLSSPDRLPMRGAGAWLADHGTIAPFERGWDEDAASPFAAAAFAQDGSATALPIGLGPDAFASTRSADGRAYVEVAGDSERWSVSSWSGTDMTLLVTIARPGERSPSWVVAGDQDGPS
jgi:hypothetical protein